MILGENAPNIELGVSVFRVKMTTPKDIRRPNSKSSNAELSEDSILLPVTATAGFRKDTVNAHMSTHMHRQARALFLWCVL